MCRIVMIFKILVISLIVQKDVWKWAKDIYISEYILAPIIDEFWFKFNHSI